MLAQFETQLVDRRRSPASETGASTGPRIGLRQNDAPNVGCGARPDIQSQAIGRFDTALVPPTFLRPGWRNPMSRESKGNPISTDSLLGIAV